MTEEPEETAKTQKRRKWRRKTHSFVVFLVLVLLAGAGIYYYRAPVMQWALQGLLKRTSLSFPEWSGIRVKLHQAQLADMQFSLQLAVGTASVRLREIKADYNPKAAQLDSLTVANARLRFAYQQAEEVRATKPKSGAQPIKASEPTTLTLPARKIAIDALDIEISTKQGTIAFTGSAELFYDEAGGIKGLIQQGEQKIRFQIAADMRAAKLSIEEFAGNRIAQLTYRQSRSSRLQVELKADALPLMNWLTSTSLIPADIRTELVLSSLYQISPELAAVKLKLQASSKDNLENIKGRLLLTRELRYLSSTELIWNSRKSRLDIDGHADMSVADVLVLAKPWLPEKAKVWRNASGDLMGTFRFKWQPNAKFNGEVYLKAYQLGGNAGPVQIRDGYVRLDIKDIAALDGGLEVDLPSLQIGEETEVNNLQLKVGYQGGMLTVQRAALPIFGGVLEVLPTRVDLEQSPVNLTVGVRKLDLAQLLDSLNYPDLSGTGTISGKLPLRLSVDSFEVRDGLLNGIEPGVLRYHGPVADEGNIAFSALRNLRYHSLQGKVDYQPSGDYRLGLRLEGKNPELLSGHPVAFNLNLSGHLPELLQKGMLAGDFDKPILEQIKTNGKQ